jgi:hypothetical protein
VSVSVAVHQPAPDSTLAVWLDSGPDLSSTNSTQDHCLDVDHQPTDRGGWGFESLAARSITTGMLVDVLWEIGSRPGLGDSLDRVDNGGNHEPGNAGWTTPGEARPEQAPLASEQPGGR